MGVCKRVIMAFIFCLPVFSIAQSMDPGKVSIDDLKASSHPADSSAAAAILYERGETSFEFRQQHNGFVMVTNVKMRIKIYKKEGYERASHSIPYYYPSESRETVNYRNAVTYNLVDGKIVKTKLKSDGEFDEKLNKYWNVKKIAMPAVKEGSIVEFEYTKESPMLTNLEPWAFQTSIPVNYSEFRTNIPEYFTYKINMKGSANIKTTKESLQKSFEVASKERGSGHATFSQDKVDYEMTRTTYIGTNLPAMKDEAFVNNIRNYTSSLFHELAMIKYPNSTPKIFATDWESVCRTIYDHSDFGDELNKTGYFEDDLTALLSGVNAPAQRMNKIFDYVKNNIKWDGYQGYYCVNGVKRAYKEKTGNVAEINLILTSMLRHAGLNAHPVLLSTRSNGIAYFPNRTAFNYVVAAVEDPSGTILLDATERYSSPNILPIRDLNWFGRLIRRDKTSAEIELMPSTTSRETVSIQYDLAENGEVSGKLRKQLTNHMALMFRDRHLSTTKDAYLETLENENGKIEIADYERDDSDLNAPVVESYAFKHNSAVDIIGGKIYLKPLLFLADDKNPFLSETREYPIDFGFPTEYKYNVSISIPAGYVVESLPVPMNVSMENKVSQFKYSIATQGDKIQVAYSFNMNEAILSADYYAALKAYFQQLIDKQQEKIVFKKA